MADATSVAALAAPLPSSDRIAEAESFTREVFLHAGEDPALALAPGTARRRALDLALREIEQGLPIPSTKWRRRYSLLLGLERVLSEDEPRLADGTSLNPHQVDALSGTLAALLTLQQGNGTAVPPPSAAPVLAVDEEPEPDDRLDLEPAAADADAEPEDEDEDADDGFDDDDEDDDDEIVAVAPPDFDDDDDEEEEPEPDLLDGAEASGEDDEADAYEDLPDEDDVDEDVDELAGEDPNASKRFWFEHATGAGKTVAAMGFVDANRTGGVLILTHRRNLVDQFLGELRDRGYGDRESEPLLGSGHNDEVSESGGPVTVETYQWFVRNAGRISPSYTVVICDEAHTALGEKTSAAIREWTGPVFIGMTATGALIARHVTDLFPTQTSRFDLAQAARRGVIAPLRCIRIAPGPQVKTIAKVPLRRGDVDVEFDQELLAELLDQLPFNMAIANLYKTRFSGVPGVIYAAGVRHASNVAAALRDEGMNAEAVSGETPKRQLASILAAYERGQVDVLVNAQLLAEGWNSPRATVCMHLAPTASRRIYQQRVGRVTRRHVGKEAGVVVDFVAPQTRNDDPVVTLHSLLDRDVYRGGAIVVGPVRRGRGRRLRVERRVVPVAAEEEARHEVFERELWRIAVEHLDWGEQHMWAALAGARVSTTGWRRARAMLHFDRSGELKRRFLLSALERNKIPQLHLRALQEIAAARDAEAFQASVDVVASWPREERREGVKILLQALAEKRIGRRDQANQWIWDLADLTRDVHEEYAVQRWPETKRLLGLLVNSSGGAHARNARRLVHASRKQDRRLSAALLAAAVAHTPEAMEVIRGARTRMARKPSSLSRELLRNFPKGRGRRNRRRKKKGVAGLIEGVSPVLEQVGVGVGVGGAAVGDDPARAAVGAAARQDVEPAVFDAAEQIAAAAGLLPARGGGGDRPVGPDGKPLPRSRRARARARRAARDAAAAVEAAEAAVAAAVAAATAQADQPVATEDAVPEAPKRPRRRVRRGAEADAGGAADVMAEAGAAAPADAGEAVETVEEPAPEKPKRARRVTKKAAVAEAIATVAEPEAAPEKPKRARRTAAKPAATPEEVASPDEAAPEKPKRARRVTKKAAVAEATATAAEPEAAPEKPKRARRTAAEPAATDGSGAADAAEPPAVKPKPKRASRAKPPAPDPDPDPDPVGPG